LTYYRVQARGVTHADPLGTFLELAYSLLRNIVPVVDERAAYPALARALHWVANHSEMAELVPAERYRLMAFLLRGVQFDSFAAFRAGLRGGDDPDLLLEGRRAFAMLSLNSERHRVTRLEADVVAYVE